MDAILNQLSSLAAKADEATRKTILTKLRDFSYSIESSDDTTHRVWGSHVHITVIRCGIQMKIFELLENSGKPMSVEEISATIKAEEVLMARILRCLASYGIIKETGLNEFQRNNVSGHLAQPGNAAAIKHYFDACGPIWPAFPTFFEKHGYKNPTDSYNTVWQEGHGSKESCFEWMMANPSAFENFNIYMAARRQNQATWFDAYPVLEDVSKDDPKLTSDRVLLIDVGGGLGHQASDFRAKFPELPSKVVNMDLPFAVEQAKSMSGPGVEHIGHDFFTPQPVKGAKYYYLRAVLHDWPDDKCQLILQNQIEAMAEDSIILIDDMVLPKQGVTWHVTQVDLTMMAAAAAMERAETQWEVLYDSVGLKVVQRAVYTPGFYETVTALVKK